MDALAATAGLRVGGVRHAYQGADGQPSLVLDGIDLIAEDRQFIAVLGPSGCGKSTLFNIIAGLVRPNGGEVRLAGADVAGRTGHVAYMMQKDLLLNWRTVLENATLGAELAGISRRQARIDAQALMGRFGLAGFEDCYPSALSGGMRQRAALLRTVLCDKPLILLDEPFSALDALTRADMQEWLLGIWQEFRRTVILITHDPEEAVFLADRIYVLTPRPARIAGIVDVQLRRPRQIDDLMSDPAIEARHRVLDLVRGRVARAARRAALA